MKVRIWYRCQKRIGNYNDHDGEQLEFYKKVHIKTQNKKKDVLVIFTLQENEWVPIYLTKAVPKRTSNCIFNMEKVGLEKS